MNKSYDVYMCRNDKRTDVELLMSSAYYPIYNPTLSSSIDDLWAYWGNKVAKDGFLTYDASGKLVRRKGA